VSLLVRRHDTVTCAKLTSAKLRPFDSIPIAAITIGRSLSKTILAYATDGRKQYPAILQRAGGPAFALGLLATGYNLREQRIDMAGDKYRRANWSH
jgi:hypothetical protein